MVHQVSRRLCSWLMAMAMAAVALPVKCWKNISLMGEFPGVRGVQMGRVNEFLPRRWSQKSAIACRSGTGNLYLEYHRGVYTTQARTKRANRKNEFLAS